MNWSILLYWMTHMREGSWAAFQRAVAELAGDAGGAEAVSRRLRSTLSDLCFASFYQGGAKRWRVFKPLLAGLSEGGGAVLCGGRTPALLKSLVSAAEAERCRLSVVQDDGGPQRVRVEATEAELASISGKTGVPYISRFASALCGSLTPVPLHVERSEPQEAPLNWTVCSFDWDSFSWVEGAAQRSALEYTSRYGAKKHFASLGRNRLLFMPRREAVYASAMIHRVPLLRYDREARELSSPMSAPLPEEYSRAACLCSGAPRSLLGARLVYKGVTEDVASVLLVSAGQRHPCVAG